MRFGWRHAGANVFVGEQLEVRLNFVVEIGFAVIGKKMLRRKLRAFVKSGMLIPLHYCLSYKLVAPLFKKWASYHCLATKLAKLARSPKKCDSSV
jgi:hypothetical protein